jgi:hypothetical protein
MYWADVCLPSSFCLALFCDILSHDAPLPYPGLVTTRQLGPCSPFSYVALSVLTQQVGVGDGKSTAYLSIKLEYTGLRPTMS